MAADYLNEIRAHQPSGPYRLVRLFLRWARGLRDRAAAFGMRERSRLRRPLRYDDESTAMATADLALHHRPAHWASAQEASGHVDATARPATAWRSEFLARKHDQSGRERTHRVGKVSPWILSRAADPVHACAPRAGSSPSRSDLAQARSHALSCPHRRRPLNHAVRAQRRLYRRVFDALPGCAHCS